MGIYNWLNWWGRHDDFIYNPQSTNNFIFDLDNNDNVVADVEYKELSSERI